MELSIFQVCATVLVNLSLAWMMGALSTQHWLSRNPSEPNLRLNDALRSAIATGMGVCFVATALSLWQAAASMADLPLLDTGPSVMLSFAATHYGVTGLASLAILAAFGLWHVLTTSMTHGTSYRVVAALLLAFFAIARVRIGHAFEFGPFSFAVLVELVHLLSMALWVGLVFIAAWVVIARFDDDATGKVNGSYLSALSHWATISLTGVLLSGLYNAFRVFNVPRELIFSPYGWLLIAKLCFVLLAVALGGWNRFFGFPAATNARRSTVCHDRFRKVLLVLRIESFALLSVLIAAAVLTGNAPPSAT